jgi:hypothetical protein
MALGVSQRDAVFKGGIKTGTTAYDEHSKVLDKNTKQAALEVFQEMQEEYPLLSFRSSIPAPIKYETNGCAPDGGIWYYKGVPIVSFEAKKQGFKGNAHDRWFKNWDCFKAYQNFSFVTFCIGQGAGVSSDKKHGTMRQSFNVAMFNNKQSHVWNSTTIGGLSFYGSVNGFEYSKVKEIMRDCVVRTIEKFHNDAVDLNTRN